MKAVTTIFIILSALSIVSGIGYLAVGFNDESNSKDFSLVTGVLQLFLASSVLVSAIAYRKYGKKWKLSFVGAASLFVGFVVYVLA